MTSRMIRASRDKVYAAFVDPDVLLKWLPPAPMTARMHSFDARVGAAAGVGGDLPPSSSFSTAAA